MNVKLFFAGLSFSAAVVSGAMVVHDAGRDLILNTSSCGVYTNVCGGVWSFMHAASYTAARTVLPGTRVIESAELKDAGTLNIILERGPSKGGASPWFGVNPRHVADSSTATGLRGAGYPAIPPGQLSCHPGNTTDAGFQCCVLRFTTPRAGTYAVTAKAWSQNVGWTAVSLLVNGEVRRERIAWKSASTSVVTNDFSLPAATYQAGDRIELTVDGNDTFNSNATGLRFEVAEDVADVVDAATSMNAHLTAAGANPSAVFTNAFGVWRVLSAPGNDTVVSQARTLLDTPSVRADQGSGAVGWETASTGVPWFYVSSPTAYTVETNAAGQVTFCKGLALAPGELYAHPQNGRPVLLGVTPATSGRYDIGVTARDLSFTRWSDGVRVSLIQGGHVLATIRVSVEGVTGVPSGASVFLPDVAVAAGVPLDLVLDCDGNYLGDGTGLSWSFVRKPGFVYSANGAFLADLRSESPSAAFTGDGASWQVGTLANCVLTPFTTLQKGKWSGCGMSIGNNESTSPYFGANLAGRALSADETGLNPVGRDMLIAHPGSGVVSTMRFTAPADGVYSAKCFVMDIDGDGGDGICAGLVVNGHRPRVDVIKSISTQIGAVQQALDGLHLKTGDTVDFTVEPITDHYCDLTGIYIWLARDAAASSLPRVNIDFDVADAQGAVATYAGAGGSRFGYRGERWNSFRLRNVASCRLAGVCRADDNVRVGLELTLTRGGAPLTVAAGNTKTEDVRDAASLFVDGVTSAAADDICAFTLSGLVPGETYRLCFYSRVRTATTPATDATTIRGVFTVGEAEAHSTHTWFSDNFGDYANIAATADADGRVTGTFASASAATAYWCGLQVEGPGFAQYVPHGTLVLIH